MNGPLLTLAKKLRAAGPPALNILISRFGEFEEYDDFVKLVKEYVPEHEDAILRLPSVAQQIAAFGSRFEDKYFPLHYSFADAEMYEIEGYGDLTRGIPLIVTGLGWEDIDRIITDGDAGQRLMTFLVPLPEDGMRVPLAEACAAYVPQELLERVPPDGFQPDYLSRLLKATRFKGLATWADILTGSTGNYFLDVDDEMYWSSGPPDWDMENVKELTRLWQQADAAWDEVKNVQVWLEKAPARHIEELLDFIERRLSIVDHQRMPKVQG